MSNTAKTFAAVILAVAQLAGAVGCAPRVQTTPVASLRRWELLDLLERERSVAVVHEAPVPLRLSSYSVANDMVGVGSAIGSSGVGGILGLPLVVAAIPVAIAESATESRREKGLEPLVVDPILTVEQRLVSALRADPALSGVEWKTETTGCSGGSCQ